MSVLQERVAQDLKEAMKKRDDRGRNVLRMLRAEFMREEIALRKKDAGLNEEEAQKILNREIKKREEAALAFHNGGREDRAQEEEAEGVILRAYMPPQLNDIELAEIVQEAIQKLGATGEKDMGAVMKEVMPRVAGKAEGSRVRDMVMKKLGGGE